MYSAEFLTLDVTDREVYFLAVKNLLLYFIRQWIRMDLFALYVNVLLNDTIGLLAFIPIHLDVIRFFYSIDTSDLVVIVSLIFDISYFTYTVWCSFLTGEVISTM